MLKVEKMKNKINRRKFIRQTGLATASVMVPGFVKALGAKTGIESADGKILVIVQLSGGNDGLNTMIPYRNDHYFRWRPTLSSVADGALRISDELAFHPEMEAMVNLYDRGFVSVINNVGYPNPNRSHFRSMDIWHTASDANKYLSTGWIGRYMDAACKGIADPSLGVEVDSGLSLAMKGTSVNGIALRDAASLYHNTNDPFTRKLLEGTEYSNSDGEISFLYKTLAETASTAGYLYEKSKIQRNSTVYPTHDFGKRFKLIADLIVSGSKTNVYYISLPGFDTHAAQLFAQKRLLKMYAESMEIFVDDLVSHKKFKEVLVVTFSEFGRRVKQNASGGTDHGTANNLFIIGQNLSKPGIYNELPNLEDLDQFDLKYTVDFRQVYATLLNKWLKTDSSAILGRPFQQLTFI